MDSGSDAALRPPDFFEISEKKMAVSPSSLDYYYGASGKTRRKSRLMTRGESSPLQKYLRGIARRHELEELTDAQLLQQYVGGNGDAIAELVKRHYALVLSACRGHFHDFSEAEDVCVAAFIVLMEKANQNWQSSVGTWPYKTAWQIAKQKQAEITRAKKREEAVKMKKPAPA